MTKKLINHGNKLMAEGGHVVTENNLHCMYSNDRVLYTMEDPGLKVTAGSNGKTVSERLETVLRGFTGNYHICYLSPLAEVRKGIREASGGRYSQRVIYTPTGQEFHLNARYMAEAMDALSTDVCYYLDDKHPVFFCQKGDINADVIEAILPIGTYYKKLDTYVAG